MAQLPQTETGRVAVSPVPNVPGGAAPRMRYPEQRQEIATEAAARYQGTLSQVLDKMGETAFGYAEKFSQMAGMQFAAENPLTAEQLGAMSAGNMSGISLGSPMNAYGMALRKARAIELSAHAEVDGRSQLVKLLDAAERGEVDTNTILDKVTAITNGYGQSLARVDPDASFKYRASMATLGSRVVDKAAEIDGRKRLLTNSVALERDYQNTLRSVSLYSGSSAPIDPTTNLPINVDQFIDAEKKRFLNNAVMLVGVQGAERYAAKMNKDMSDVKVSSITEGLVRSGMSNDGSAITRLQNGDAGPLTASYQSLLPEERAKVMANFMTEDGNRHTFQQRRRAEANEANSKTALSTYRSYLEAEDPEEKAKLKNKLLDMNVLSYDMTRTLIEGPKTTKAGMGIFHIETQIDNGTLSTNTDLLAQSEKYDIPPDQIVLLRRRLDSRVTADVSNSIKRLAGISDSMLNLNPASDNAKRYFSYQDRFYTAQETARAEGKPFDGREFVRTLEREKVERMNSDTAAAARTQLADYSKRFGSNITSENIDAVEQQVQRDLKANRKPKITPQEVLRVKQLLKEAGGY
jgi:hypothetical protein